MFFFYLPAELRTLQEAQELGLGHRSAMYSSLPDPTQGAILSSLWRLRALAVFWGGWDFA